MSAKWGRFLAALTGSVLALPAAAAALAAAAKAPTASLPAPIDARGRHERIVQAYLHNQWKELEEALKVPAKDLAQFSKQQRDDVAYVRTAWAECRPPWWNRSKLGKEFAFSPTIWGKSFTATFSPEGKEGFHMETVMGRQLLTFTWKVDDLDSTAPPNDKSMAGHGTKRGDMAETGLWCTMSSAALVASLPFETLNSVYQSDKEGFQRFDLFQSQLAALYHGSPRARHAAMVIYFSGFMKKYGSGPMAGTRRAIGSMLIAEFLAEPSKWPSIRLPDSLPPDNAEGAFAEHCIGQIDRGWTLAEDRAVRAAALAFYKANGREVLKTGRIVLPNKLTTMLDPDKDAKPKAERDAWVIRQLQKARKAD